MQDLTVLDFSANAAGPACAMLLADFGADVLKIEPPAGDATRKWGKSRFGENGQFTGSFLSLNRNKRGVVLDLKSNVGRRAARALIERADVVIHSFLPKVAERLELDYAHVAQINPRIIHCAISGFGLNGRLKDRPGFDMLLQAFAGHLAITGEPGRPSVRIGPSSIDLLTAAHAAFAILVALRERDRSGIGQTIDASLYQSAIHMIGNHLADYSGSGIVPEKFGSRFPNMAPYGYFQASDREFFIGISSDDMWHRFCDEVAEPALTRDDFATNSGRLQHRDLLDAILSPIFRMRTAQEWVNLAVKLSIPATLIYSIPEVLAHEQATDFLLDTGIDGVKIPGIPVTLSRTPGVVRRHAPKLGEHSEQVLGERILGDVGAQA
jgi:crotonobetainyl-CoA:carnitine CoA-transferase CaiB-like acyl-CoA transferase